MCLLADLCLGRACVSFFRLSLSSSPYKHDECLCEWFQTVEIVAAIMTIDLVEVLEVVEIVPVMMIVVALGEIGAVGTVGAVSQKQ